MKRFLLLFCISALATPLYFGCKKPQTYDAVPSIEFLSLTSAKNSAGLDTASLITISFTDGDGDIGYNPGRGSNREFKYGSYFEDSTSIYYDNFVVHFFEKKAGTWVEDTTFLLPNGLPSYSARLPYLTPSGDNKALKGEITMIQHIQFNPVRNDTIRYSVYIYDRELHQSNTITTPEIVITTTP